MRWRPAAWLVAGLICIVAIVCFRAGTRRHSPAPAETALAPARTGLTRLTEPDSSPLMRTGAVRVLSPSGSLNAPRLQTAEKSLIETKKPVSYRLTNTTQTKAELAGKPTAILLLNAQLDTAEAGRPVIPDHLKAGEEAGAYIVQSRTSVDNGFRAMLQAAGATYVSYIPNNACLAQMSAAVAGQLRGMNGVQAVLPYEPYYKIQPSLIEQAVEQEGLPDNAVLKLLLFPDALDATIAALEKTGARIVGEEKSRLGPVVHVAPTAFGLPAVAGVPGVRVVEPLRSRMAANDLSRQKLAISLDTKVTLNYLGLTGTNVTIAVNDSGVDGTHPDLTGRVAQFGTNAPTDFNGHGTHVIGSILGSGAMSSTVTNARGSILPITTNQFRGMANAAGAFVIPIAVNNRPFGVGGGPVGRLSDYDLQVMAAQAGVFMTNNPGIATNIFISNNSWVYGGDYQYDIAAASYDAATRDALPTVTGTSPLLFVFAAGNDGSGDSDTGLGGVAESIESPATAKNVITVGAMEQPRNITNVVTVADADNCAVGGTNITTSQPWLAMTHTDNMVAGLSSRGNVHIRPPTDPGRFKPDVVAPGIFVISTRSAQWDQASYYNPTNISGNVFTNQIVTTNGLWNNIVFIPCDTVSFSIRVFGVKPNVDLPIYIGYNDFPTTNTYDLLGTNTITIPPDAALNPILGTSIYYSVGDPTNVPVNFSIAVSMLRTNAAGDYYTVLSNLNNTLGSSNTYYYRFESGTSMSAAMASGTLALMQEQMQQRLGMTNISPALMKALLINGARPVNDIYDYQVTNVINIQGWGQINLTNSLLGGLTNSADPISATPIKFIDQNLTNSLSTGQSRTYNLAIAPSARNRPLRVTLVWTDPPGDPVASVDLVNDLDLVVTNVVTTNIYFGNDIPSRHNFNQAWVPGTPANIDTFNNVESVYLNAPLGSNYTVTVFAHHVNVNAVSAHPDNTVQDFALVISSGNGEVTNALTIPTQSSGAVNAITINYLTNQFGANSNLTGAFLLDQRVGANTPLLGTNQIPLTGGAGEITLGMTNQWHFYAITNINNFAYATFGVFLPPELAVPRMGATNENNPSEATRPEADIDLYVSTDPGLLVLDPVAVNNSLKSLSRSGTESITISNANALPPVFYIGVKSEDHMAAQYDLIAAFSSAPFCQTDSEGNITLPVWIVVPILIPDGTPNAPGQAIIYSPGPGSDCGGGAQVRRAAVTDLTINHERFGDLGAELQHNNKKAVLMAHQFPGGAQPIDNNHQYIFDDSGQGDIPNSVNTDGYPPLGLTNFVGSPVAGPWLLIVADNALNQTGAVVSVSLEISPHTPTSGGAGASGSFCLPQNQWYYDYVDVPDDATNMTICVGGNSLPIGMYVKFGDVPTLGNYDLGTNFPAPGGCLSISSADLPPLQPLQAGRYWIGFTNPNLTVQCAHYEATVYRSPATEQVYTSIGGSAPIYDDAVSYAYITNNLPFDLVINGLDVGLQIDYPRISDLAITLISPNGTRILLMEQRGAWTAVGLGTSGYTNYFLAPFYTNNFDGAYVGPYAPSAWFEGWTVLTNYSVVASDWTCLCESNHVLVLRDGAISNNLPTLILTPTNPEPYMLSFKVTHAPYLVGTVAWWPLDGNALDIFGGHDGLLCCNTTFATGEVAQALFTDGVRASMMVPRCCPDLDVGQGGGFTIEGWINPTTNGLPGPVVMNSSFETVPATAVPFAAGSYLEGWLVESGDVKLVYPGLGFPGLSDTGVQAVDLNGTQSGSISTNVTTIPGRSYQLTFAYCKNPNLSGAASMTVDITGQTNSQFNYNGSNTVGTLNWSHATMVFTAAAATTKIQLTSLNAGNGGMFVDSFILMQLTPANVPAPLVEWNDATNPPPQGVQFRLGGLDPLLPIPGSLAANIWDTNLTPHVIQTPPGMITNGGWQHVALTYETNSRIARIYTNGSMALALTLSSSNFVPRTAGELYFGIHPDIIPQRVLDYYGGMDEFGLYNRALSDTEIFAIYHAGSRGKYGTNVLLSPVGVTVELPALGIVTNFINGTNWFVTGPHWETNYISFNVSTNLWPTNMPIVVRPTYSTETGWQTNINVALDEFVLWGLGSNVISGLVHFTEDTNIAQIPIKFAPTPYQATNFPNTALFTNDFERTVTGGYTNGDTVLGAFSPTLGGYANWKVTRGALTVISNASQGIVGSNKWIALAEAGIQSTLPTVGGHRYQLSYAVRGPCAVGWWNGQVNELNNRARDLIGNNDGAFFDGATNFNSTAISKVGANCLGFFGGTAGAGLTNVSALTNKIELGDPQNLKFTNSFTIETWIYPVRQTNGTFIPEQIEQLFFRGDMRQYLDPYFLGIEQTGPDDFDVIFHVGVDQPGNSGVVLETGDQPLLAGQWQHLAAVFENYMTVTNDTPSTNGITTTNELRLYLNGKRLTDVFLEQPFGQAPIDFNGWTWQAPFQELDQSYSPGVSIGNVSRNQDYLPYRGYMDELTVYSRALTEPEIFAIYTNGAAGKSDPSQPPPTSLAEVAVSLDGVIEDLGHGDNSSWTIRTIEFTASSNTTLLNIQGLLPTTLISGVVLTEIPQEVAYLPEEALSALNGESANGIWTLEIWDTRAGGYSGLAQLVTWQLTFGLKPRVPLPVVHLQHGIPYTNNIPAGGVQFLVADVPQWALYATNQLIFASQSVGVLYDPTNTTPGAITNAIFWPPVTAGLTNLTTNSFISSQYIVPGQPYYLAVTNPHPFAIAYAYELWYDLTTLTNCEYVTNLTVGPAGIPRYFQFDIPTNSVPLDIAKSVSFWLSGAQTNLTVVLSEHLPLPDLAHYDYISAQPCTNQEVIMVVTNSTPWPVQTNRWYVGVFNNGSSNVAFNLEACYQTNYPSLIPLTNSVPFFAPLTSPWVAPPGPPRFFYFTFDVTNIVSGVLFELYGMSGQADLLLQRDVPPTMSPYFSDSFRMSSNAEQIVLRPTVEFPDLRGTWYLGVYNHEGSNNVAYTIRAALPSTNGLLLSGLPLTLQVPVPLPQGLLLQWNAVSGELYYIQFTPTLSPPVWTTIGSVVASTPCATFVVQNPSSGFYRVVQIPVNTPPGPASLKIQKWVDNQLRLSWPLSLSGYVLQQATSFAGPWTNVTAPVTVEGNEFVVYVDIGPVPTYYRLQ